MNKKISTKTLALCSILTAIVVILQFMGAFLHFGPFSVSLVLIPIVIGAALCGPAAGAWLGFAFSVVVFLSGDAGAFLALSVPGTLITVLLKGTLCGLAAGLIYKLLEKHNRYLAVTVAAIVCPIVNTGIFLLGCRLFFWDTIISWGQAEGFNDVAKYVIFVLVGGNFLFELGLNVFLSPIITRILKTSGIR